MVGHTAQALFSFMLTISLTVSLTTLCFKVGIEHLRNTHSGQVYLDPIYHELAIK